MKPYVPCAMKVRAKTSPLSTYAAVIVPRSWRSTASRGTIAATPTRPYASRRLESRLMAGERYAVVSCHVERPLDDRVWQRFEALQAARPGGFRIAALMRPPDAEAGEDEARWLERARRAAELGPSGRRLLELPSTHSIGMLVRALPRRLDEPLVHVYFHDTDLLDRRRALALHIALRVLSLRRTPSDLDAVQRDFRPAKTTMFAVSRG